MAYLTTIQLLIDAESECTANTIANDLAGQMGADGQVIDWNVESTRGLNETLSESISTGNYVMGECFGEYLVISKAKRNADASFWSNTFGWTSYDLATRFDAFVLDLPTGLNREEAAFHMDRGPEQMSQLLATR